MLTWVFGGTCSGKKHYIISKTQGAKKACWLHDGSLEIQEARELRKDKQDFLIRWQWGRENTIRKLAKVVPPREQEIIFLSVPPEILLERATKRGEETIFSLESLSGDAESAEEMAIHIAAELSLKMKFVPYGENK